MRRIVFTFGLMLSLVLLGTSPVRAEGAPTPEKLALSKRFIAALEMEATIGATMKSMVPAFVQMQRQKIPSLTEAQGKIVETVVIETMAEITPDYIDKVSSVYAETFTTEELTQSIAFYETPAGRSVIKKSQTMGPKIMPIMMDMMPEIEARMKNKLCAKIKCETKPHS
jgi:uncharacterized protein